MANRYALIIGTSDYQDSALAHLAMPEADVNGLADVLKDPQIGAFDSVKPLVNRPSFEVRYEIESFFDDKKPDDLLLLYYTGHGIRDEQGQLYLALNDTKHNRLRSTAIDAAYITGLMDGSRSRRQVFILDCCHSGSFAQGSKAMTGESVGTREAFQGTGYGRVVLTATDATQYAWEGDQIVGEAQNSVFTLFLLQALRSGEADSDNDGKVTLDELYDYVYEKVVNVTPKQTPGKWSYKQQGEIIIANNPRAVAQPAALPAPLQHAIESPLPSVRQAAVQDLEQLLQGSSRGLALAARDALQRLAQDDSRRVASAASAALKTFGETQAKAPAEPNALAPGLDAKDEAPVAPTSNEVPAVARSDVPPKPATVAPADTAGSQARANVPSTATRGGRPWWLLIGGGILVGMCICILAFATALSGITSSTPTPVARPTATPLVARPTPTRVEPTATPVVRVTPTPVAPSSVVFTDDFKGSCKLPEGDNDQRTLACADGQYTILNKVNNARWVYYAGSYNDIVLEADARAVSGPTFIEYGVIFRVASDAKSFYGFTVTTDGRFTLFKYKDPDFSDLIPYTDDSSIKKQTGTNHIKVVAQGNQIAIYLNDQWLNTVSDSSFSSGSVGFFINNNTANAKAAFSHLVVSQINSQLALPAGRLLPTPTAKP